MLEKKDKDDKADYLHQQADEDQALFQCLQCFVCASECVCVRRERGKKCKLLTVCALVLRIVYVVYASAYVSCQYIRMHMYT